MLSNRRRLLKEYFQTKPFIKLTELEALFPRVSSMTLRRDIEYFEKAGDVIKVRGGARSMKFIKTSLEDPFETRENENPYIKEIICKKAAEYMEQGRSIFLDSGTTMLKFAEHIKDERLTITTTAPNVAIKLLRHSNIIVNIVGGMVNRDNISVAGTQAMEFLGLINIDTAFIVPSGFSVEHGFTSGNYSECEIKQLIVKKAAKKILLLDNGKIGKNLPYTFAGLKDIDVLISNDYLPYEILRSVEEYGVKIVHVNSEKLMI